MQSMADGVPTDGSFEQWLLRALNNPSLPGVIDMSPFMGYSLTAEEVRQLKLALQSNSNVRVLKLCAKFSRYDRRSLIKADGLSQIAEPLGKLTALQQLDLYGTSFIF
jgi:hypothetical protein